MKIYLSFMIWVKEEKLRMFWSFRDIQTDYHSVPDAADEVNWQSYKH